MERHKRRNASEHSSQGNVPLIIMCSQRLFIYIPLLEHVVFEWERLIGNTRQSVDPSQTQDSILYEKQKGYTRYASPDTHLISCHSYGDKSHCYRHREILHKPSPRPHGCRIFVRISRSRSELSGLYVEHRCAFPTKGTRRVHFQEQTALSYYPAIPKMFCPNIPWNFLPFSNL